MSYDAQSWARKVVTGSPVRKAVLMSIANRANDADGACWPSQRRIADETEFCERAVRKALADLEDLGLIRREKRKDTTDLIYVMMPDPDAGGTIKPPASPAGGNTGENRPSRTQRHQIPATQAGDSAPQRYQIPEGAAPDAGDYRHDVPTNLSDESITEPSVEPTKKLNPSFPSDSFKQFWKLYPDKKGKQYCQDIWETKIECGKTPFENIMKGLRTYIRCKPKDRPWLNPSTFLNQARWEDEWNESSRDDRSNRMAI
jgi:Helix-turn-helix domain